MALIYDVAFDSQTRALSLLDKAGNVISSCEVPSKSNVDDITKPLTFRATQDGSTVILTREGSPAGAFQTSRDGGNTWTNYIIGTALSLNTGDEVSFRAMSNRTSAQDNMNYVHFIMKGKIEAWHNAYSMISPDFSSTEGSVGEYGMNGLFENCSSLTKAPLLLNALSRRCYIGTFLDCTSLTKAPELPATTLAIGCYIMMFEGCVSLTKAPSLPATTLEDTCYSRMFYGCSKLKEVRIAATTRLTTTTDALKNWLYGVSATGDFYCDPNATVFPTDSASGIPKGWRRLNIHNYPTTP